MKLPAIALSKMHHILLGLITLFFVILYFPYLKNDPILKRDDALLIYPLKTIHSLPQYANAVMTNVVLDFQPLRDATFFLNLKIEESTGIMTYHLFNLLLMVFSIHLLFKIFVKLKWSKGEIAAGILLFACHPILVSGLGWISTRKHLLGLMFCLLSLYDILKKERLSKSSVAWYVCSILSQQIFILFPLWAFLYSRFRKFEVSKKVLASMITCGTGVLAFSYYKTFIQEMGNATFQYYSTAENIGRFVLSSGRAVVIMLFPNVISHSYYQGSIYNMIGIVLFVLYLYAVYKSPSRNECFLWILLAGLTLIPTYIAFVNDTYLYLPLFCIIVSSITMLKPFYNQKLIGAFVIAIVLLTVKTVSASRMWLSDIKLWQYSYEQEQAPMSALYLGKQLLEFNEELAIDFLHAGAKDYNLMDHSQMMILFVNTIHASKLSLEKKISIMEECFVDHDIYKGKFGLILIEGNKELSDKGLKLLKTVLTKHESNYEPNTIGAGIIQDVRKTCLSSFDKTYICNELNITY